MDSVWQKPFLQLHNQFCGILFDNDILEHYTSISPSHFVKVGLSGFLLVFCRTSVDSLLWAALGDKSVDCFTASYTEFCPEFRVKVVVTLTTENHLRPYVPECPDGAKKNACDWIVAFCKESRQNGLTEENTSNSPTALTVLDVRISKVRVVSISSYDKTVPH